jgi:hypothetical protein
MVLCVSAAVALWVSGKELWQRKTNSISCGNFMSSICLGMRIWREDNSNAFPAEFSVLSNELSTTKILICPSDRVRKPSAWGSTLQASYQLIPPGTNVVALDAAVLRCPIHRHIGYADGTIFDGKQRRTK